MESLHDDLLKLSSEMRKRKKRDDCLNLEKELDQEILLLDKRKSRAAPCSSHSRSYTHDTSIRKGGTTKPRARMHKKKTTLDTELKTSQDVCKLNSI